MAEVGKARSPRLPTGPKPDAHGTAILDSDDVIIEPTHETEQKTIHNATVTIEQPKDNNFEELKPRAKIPIPSSKKFLEEDSKLFYKYLADLKPEHWIQLSWYFYRKFPRIIRPDEQKYIDCGAYAFDDDWILREHGSGDYMCILNDSGKPKNAKTIVTAHIKLNDPSYPPKVKMDELDVYYPGNRFYVDKMIAEGKLTTDRKPMNSPQALGNDAVVGLLGKMIDRLDRSQLNNLKDPKDNAINTAIEIMAKGNQAATQMMLDQMKQEDPEKLLKLVAAIGNLIPKPVEHKDDSGSQLMKFLEIMEKKDATIMNLMTKFMEKATTPVTPPATDDGFDKSLDRFLKLMELTGLGEGGGKKSTLEVALQYGTPILDRALGIAQNLLALKAQGVPKIGEVPNAVNQPGTSGLPVAISTAPPEVIQGQSNPAKEGGKVDPRAAMQENAMQQEQAIKQGLKQIGPRIIDALNRGVTGSQFAESIDGFMGPMVYNQLASLGETKILEILKSDAQLWSQLASVEPILISFVKDFISYGEPEGGDDEIIDASEGDEKVGSVGEEIGKKVN